MTEISAADYELAVAALAAYLIEEFDAPGPEPATEAARSEIDDMASLCDHPPATLLAITRAITGENISEKTRVITPADKPGAAKIWAILEDDE